MTARRQRKASRETYGPRDRASFVPSDGTPHACAARSCREQTRCFCEQVLNLCGSHGNRMRCKGNCLTEPVGHEHEQMRGELVGRWGPVGMCTCGSPASAALWISPIMLKMILSRAALFRRGRQLHRATVNSSVTFSRRQRHCRDAKRALFAASPRPTSRSIVTSRTRTPTSTFPR